MSIKSRLETVATGTLVFCALFMTVVAAKRELSPPASARSHEPVAVKDWKKFDVGDKRIGEKSAPVRIIEFSDFQCPFCRRFAETISKANAKYPGSIEVVFRNFPLNTIHPFAHAAAVAAECASAQNRFVEMHDFAFSHQDSLGVLQWDKVAAKIGIADTSKFSLCTRSNEVLAKLQADSSAAVEVGVPGTPTVVINGLKYDGTPSAAQLDSAITRILSSKK
ncbi:MAG: thioredoxin domain-containing protein [Gemmatimonadaceae bacterium]